jgi:hypothetical protein
MTTFNIGDIVQVIRWRTPEGSSISSRMGQTGTVTWAGNLNNIPHVRVHFDLLDPDDVSFMPVYNLR